MLAVEGHWPADISASTFDKIHTTRRGFSPFSAQKCRAHPLKG